MGGQQAERRNKAKTASSPEKEKKADKDKKPEEPSFVQRHVLKLQLLCAFGAFAVSLAARLNTPMDHSNFVVSVHDPKGWYAKLGREYEGLVAHWGYDLPARFAERFDELHTVNPQSKGITILDIGAGSGLAGIELKRMGYTNLIGLDISPEMIALAQENHTGTYERMIAADANAPLMELSDGSFDAIVSVATTQYLALEKRLPNSGLALQVLKDWLRLVKVGGLLGFTVESSGTDAWSPAMDALSEEGAWEKVEVSDSMKYLPNHEEVKLSKMDVHLYFYRKTAVQAAKEEVE